MMQVPEGFTKQLIATEPQVMDPVAFCFDDQGNILVAESFRQEQGVEDNRSSSFWLDHDLSLQTIDDRLEMYKHFSDQRKNGMEYYSEYEDRIRLLKDTDSDGVFETATIYADGFNEPLDGTGAGVLAIGGLVYYTCIPHVWAFENGEKKSLFQGFGVRTALRGHDMHGLAIGLDGRLYWSIGDRGYHIEIGDGTTLHSPGEGAVFRSELDGTNLEVFHHGLRNPQELAFDKYGNLFTGDNNSDASDKARLVYCVEGGETGWRMEYQTLSGVNERGPWITEHGWDPFSEDRPAWILPAIDIIGSGPSGLVAYPGAGFPDRYDDHFFMCDFRGGAQNSNVLSFAVEPDGAHFKMVDLHPFAEQVLCTDVDFGYEGKMFISDWGEGWTGNKEGRVYSVWDEKHCEEGNVSEIFANGFRGRSSEELIEMLSHVDRRVRIRSQYELAERTAVSELQMVLRGNHQLAQIHAMWALSMIAREGQNVEHYIAPLLSDSDPEIRSQACKIVGELKYKKAFDKIVALIDDSNPRVSYFATIAAGHLGNAHDAIIAMLERNNNEDVFLRHAGVVALTNSQYPSAMVNLHTHPSSAVRLVAVLVLRRMESKFISYFLEDQDDVVATETARSIHDGRIFSAMGDLAKSLPKARTVPWQKRAISANKMSHDCEGSIRVATFAVNENKPEAMRILAMQALRNWNPSTNTKANRDIVEGRVIPNKQGSIVCIGDLQDQIQKIILQTSGELLLETLRFANEQHIAIVGVEEFVRDVSIPMDVRVYLLQQRPSEELLGFALNHDRWELRVAARNIMLEKGDPTIAQLLLKTVNSGEVYEAQAALQSLESLPSAFAKINKSTLRNELKLEYAEAASLKFENDWLLSGGNPYLGERIVYNNPRSQCLRCHAIGEQGGIAGPPLDGVADRLTEKALQEALLIPNQEVAEGFGEYSAMPPMGGLLNHRDLRDVIAYLKTLRADQ